MKVTLLTEENYLSTIKNSVGTSMFKNLFALVDGKKQDITKNGELSCAYFVSSVLLILGLITHIHSTVSGTVRDLEGSEWNKVLSPEAGDVLVWEAKTENDEAHKHIGFYIGENQAVSNDSKLGTPSIHSWDYHSKRKIEAIYRKSFSAV